MSDTLGNPLEGVRILELGQIIAGTYGCQVLTDLGAEVIKIEPPHGDLGRNPSVAPYKGASGLFLTFNRNKKSVVIDLKTDEGRELFYDLVRLSDVVIDNFRSGVLKRLKVDYKNLKKINPRIIQCTVTGFGTEGVYKDFPAWDITIQAISGHMSITGEKDGAPVRLGAPFADLSGGIFSCKAILAALFDRERNGKGRYIELSMFDAMLNLMTYIGTMYLTNGEVPQRMGSEHEYTVPWGAFAASDGFVVIATRQEIFWQKLCEVMEQPDLADDERFATNSKRVENGQLLIPIIKEIFAQRTVDDWVKALRAADVPASPLNTLDAAFAEPPVAERNMIVEYDHPEVGKVRLPGNPIKMSGLSEVISSPAPLLGEHTDKVLSELLNLSAGQLKDLHSKGVIKKSRGCPR